MPTHYKIEITCICSVCDKITLERIVEHERDDANNVSVGTCEETTNLSYNELVDAFVCPSCAGVLAGNEEILRKKMMDAARAIVRETEKVEQGEIHITLHKDKNEQNS